MIAWLTPRIVAGINAAAMATNPDVRPGMTRNGMPADAKLSKNPTKAQITAVVKTTTAPSIQAQINGIRALGAPSGDQATVTNMLNLAQADLNKVKSNPASLATGGASPFADFAKVAHPYGLTACAQNA